MYSNYQSNPMQFNSGAIRPVECFQTAWELIKPDYWTFLGVTLVGLLLAGLAPLGLLMGPMMCGIYLCFFQRLRGQKPSFEILFKGFEVFLPSFLVGLIQTIPGMVVGGGFYVVFLAQMMDMQRRNPSPDEASRFLMTFLSTFLTVLAVLVVVTLVMSILFFFTFQLIVDRKLNAIDAIKTSAQAALANLGGIIGLICLNILVGLAGVLCCYIGVFFVIPFGLGASAIAYRQVFPDLQPKAAYQAPVAPYPPVDPYGGGGYGQWPPYPPQQ